MIQLCYMAHLTLKNDYPGGSNLITWACKRREFPLAAQESIGGSQRHWKHEEDYRSHYWLEGAGDNVTGNVDHPRRRKQTPADRQQGNGGLTSTTIKNWILPMTSEFGKGPLGPRWELSPGETLKEHSDHTMWDFGPTEHFVFKAITLKVICYTPIEN